jgi:hypothetical protein
MRKLAGLPYRRLYGVMAAASRRRLPPTRSPPPSATITTTGVGSLVPHPRLNQTFAIVMETRLRSVAATDV